MYFVVFIIQTRRHVIVPHSWIKEINFHAENIINNGINHNRKFMVFWTDNPEAFIGQRPLRNYAPNVFASTTSIFPDEGWYSCYIKRFKCKCLIIIQVFNSMIYTLVYTLLHFVLMNLSLILIGTLYRQIAKVYSYLFCLSTIHR